MATKSLGEHCIDLIKESVRVQDGLSPFNEDKVRKCLDEMKTLYNVNAETLENNGSVVSPCISVRHEAIERNKRCVLAYLNHRVTAIRNYRWDFGAVLPPELKRSMCEPELAYFSKYSRDLASYMRSVGVDLMTDQRPPKSYYIEVRVKSDYGEMETDDGDIIMLKKNTQHYLPRNLCEPLIRQGILEHIV